MTRRTLAREIDSFAELADTMTALHDCPFDLDRSMFRESSKSWTGVFLRPLWDDPRAENKGLPFVYERIRLPVAEATVKVTDVCDVAVVEDQGIGRYTFNEVQLEANGVCLCFNEQMRIDLRVSGQLHATYEERDSPTLRAVYRESFLVQSGPSIEELEGQGRWP